MKPRHIRRLQRLARLMRAEEAANNCNGRDASSQPAPNVGPGDIAYVTGLAEASGMNGRLVRVRCRYVGQTFFSMSGFPIRLSVPEHDLVWLCEPIGGVVTTLRSGMGPGTQHYRAVPIGDFQLRRVTGPGVDITNAPRVKAQ